MKVPENPSGKSGKTVKIVTTVEVDVALDQALPVGKEVTVEKHPDLPSDPDLHGVWKVERKNPDGSYKLVRQTV